MKRKTLLIVVVVVLVLVLGGVLTLRGIGLRRGRVTVAKDTTHVTEPVRPDGRIDYLAAINQRYCNGVTPENNASVLLWKAMGPKNIGEPSHAKFFAMLGMAPLPPSGDYFVDSGQIWERLQAEGRAKAVTAPPASTAAANQRENDPAVAMFNAAMERPWSRQESPVLAAWLDGNSRPLAMVVEASQRPRRYDPLYCAGDDAELVIGALLPGSQQSRELVRALQLRAMLRLNENRIDEAWDDLLACHRLGRLMGQGPCIVDMLIGVTLDGIACRGDQAMLRYARHDPEQLAKMRADLDQLPPMPQILEKIDGCERLMYLDVVSYVALHGPAGLSQFFVGGRKGDPTPQQVGALAGALVNWDSVARNGNDLYDQYVDALHKPTRTERYNALNKIDADLRAGHGWPRAVASSIVSPRESASDAVSRMLSSLLAPAASAACNGEDRGTMTFQLDKLAFALAAYRADVGTYPRKLADLTPKYVAELPKDIFNDADLHYERKGDGYLMYSVGRNGVDDGGKDPDNYVKGDDARPGDDIAVRMPTNAKRPEEP